MKDVVHTVHQNWFWVVVVSNGLVGIWGLLAHWREPFRKEILFRCSAAAQIAAVVQVVLGVTLVATGWWVIGKAPKGVHAPSVPPFHVFYGVVTAFTVALAFLYARGSEWVRQKRYLFTGCLGLFVMGLGIRAYMQVHGG